MKWEEVAKTVYQWMGAHRQSVFLDETQRASLGVIAERIPDHGLVIADEVGTGKTRIASTVACGALRHGGTVVIVVPRGLIHQWKQELREVAQRVGYGDLKIIALESFFSLATATELHESKAGGRLVILPHNFRFPIIRYSSPNWRYDLAAMVGGALIERDARFDAKGRGSFLSYYRSEKENIDDKESRMIASIAELVYAMKNGERSELVNQIFQLSFIERDGRRCPDPSDYFDEDGKIGRRLTERLVGLLIGDVNLLVVDEAHKSREYELSKDEAEKKESKYLKVLGRLLGNILIYANNSRVLSLTATPVEMGADQWRSILSRTRIHDLINSPDALKPVELFAGALANARKFPDDPEVLERLLTASRQFERCLKRYVIRRRSIDQPFMKRFLLATHHLPHSSHKHRRVEKIAIPFSTLSEKWKRIISACEGLARASQGLPVTHSEKQVYLRIASGNLSADLLFDKLSEEGKSDEQAADFAEVASNPDAKPEEKAQWARVAFWREVLKREVGRRGGFELDLYSHPRLRRAADEIETRVKVGEKVLVFGFLVDPLRRLRDLVNTRYVLACLDRGQTVSKSMLARNVRVRDLGYRLLKQEYLELVRSGRVFDGFLKPGQGGVERKAESLPALFEDATKKYERQRDRLRGVTETSLRDLNGELFDPSLRPSEREDIVRYVRSNILERLAYQQYLGQGESGSPANWRETGIAVVEELMEILKADERGTGEGEEENGENEQEKADERRKQGYARLVEAVRQSGNIGSFCRQMDGSTDWQTRRYIQNGFNRATGFPRVLIAQSMVGREGLNLHKACRVVVQFHPEWNPGIIEQQIGRVDRHNSLWMEMAREWLKTGARPEKVPLIDVLQIVFEGTYDEHQWRTLFGRKGDFDAALFSTLLPPDALNRVPETHLERLRKEAPDFTPRPKYRISDVIEVEGEESSTGDNSLEPLESRVASGRRS